MAKKAPRRVRDQYTVVLEDIRDKVTLVAEATQPIPHMREKLDATLEEVGNLRTDMGVVKEEVGNLRTDMEVVKADLRIIKNDLKAKVDREEFEALEERVERLEAAVRTR